MVEKLKMYLGIDIGSISIKFVIINENLEVVENDYFRTKGDVVNSLKKILSLVKTKEVKGVGVTGSARKFVSTLISADFDVDEITAHRIAVNKLYPDVKTIFEIGGQDSKLIYFSKNNIGFEMNNVCAAGTGSFLDQQAARLELSIEEFCKMGLSASESYEIASKCTVFAETDMVHAQQSGIPINKIIRGVHKGLVNNYFSQLCRGKKLQGKFLFEGGTSENPILVEEFENRLLKNNFIKNKNELIVPDYNKIIGAIGVAMLCAHRGINNLRPIPQINKFKLLESKKCFECPNKCGARVTTLEINNKILTVGRPCRE